MPAFPACRVLRCAQSHCCIFIPVMMDGTAIKPDLTLFSPPSLFSQRLYDPGGRKKKRKVPHSHPWATLSVLCNTSVLYQYYDAQARSAEYKARKSGFRLCQRCSPAHKLNGRRLKKAPYDGLAPSWKLMEHPELAGEHAHWDSIFIRGCEMVSTLSGDLGSWVQGPTTILLFHSVHAEGPSSISINMGCNECKG